MGVRHHPRQEEGPSEGTWRLGAFAAFAQLFRRELHLEACLRFHWSYAYVAPFSKSGSENGVGHLDSGGIREHVGVEEIVLALRVGQRRRVLPAAITAPRKARPGR